MGNHSQLVEEHFKLAKHVVQRKVNAIMKDRVADLAFNMGLTVSTKMHPSSQCILPENSLTIDSMLPLWYYWKN
jgi:hypothetical protein